MKYQLVVFLIFFFLVSCIETPEEKKSKEDYGPTVNADEIISALNKAAGNSSAESILDGEFVIIDTDTKVETSSPCPYFSTAKSVSNRSETDADIYLTIVEESVGYINTSAQRCQGVVDESTRMIREHTYKISKSIPIPVPTPTSTPAITPTATPSSSLTSIKPFNEENLLWLNPRTWVNNPKIKSASSETKITYHRLTVTDSILEDLPQAVIDGIGCDRFPDCKMHVTTIEFDQVAWLSDGAQRMHYLVEISPDVPFLATQIKLCRTAQAPYVDNGIERSALVTQCDQVRNFCFESSNCK